MRMVRIALIPTLLLAVCAPGAYAAFIPAAISILGGSVTQAPAGNIFGVGVGSPVSGEIFWPPSPVYPPSACFTNVGCVDTNFAITLQIGVATYPPGPIAPGGSVTILNGVVTSIVYQWPPTPVFPALTLAGAQFFAAGSTTGCQIGVVCGTLDFTRSQIQPVPEPSSAGLLTISFLGLAIGALRKSKRQPKEMARAGFHRRSA